MKKIMFFLLLGNCLFAAEYNLKVDKNDYESNLEVHISDMWESSLTAEEFHLNAPGFVIDRLVVEDRFGIVKIGGIEYQGTVISRIGRIVFLPAVNMVIDDIKIRSVVFYFNQPYFKYFIESEGNCFTSGEMYEKCIEIAGDDKYIKVFFNRCYQWAGVFTKE